MFLVIFVIEFIIQIVVVIILVAAVSSRFYGYRRQIASQQLICRDSKYICQERQDTNIGAGLIVFPFADRLGCDAQLLSQLFLCQSQALALCGNSFSKGVFHRSYLLAFLYHAINFFKKLSNMR